MAYEITRSSILRSIPPKISDFEIVLENIVNCVYKDGKGVPRLSLLSGTTKLHKVRITSDDSYKIWRETL